MLKATTPVAVLIAGYGLGTEKPDYLVFTKVSAIVFGVIIASYGEVQFVLIGFIFQVLGIATEATRLVMVQQLLKDYKMDPMVSLYHFAPVCAVMNAIACVFVEGKRITYQNFAENVGIPILLLNCAMALFLNISVVFLIGKTSSLVMCLSGVFKDILLVVVSVMIWATPVMPLQVFGYGIALIGLVWYKQPDIPVKQLATAFVFLSVVSVLMVFAELQGDNTVLSKVKQD
ncbi:hypothetical protein HDU82_002228 [Entophlyctis luteolus]|nr:hypothetical protein HDU82_002228 [Entophlyctis luteolus]